MTARPALRNPFRPWAERLDTLHGAHRPLSASHRATSASLLATEHIALCLLPREHLLFAAVARCGFLGLLPCHFRGQEQNFVLPEKEFAKWCRIGLY